MTRKNISGLGKILAAATLMGLPFIAGCEKPQAEEDPFKGRITIRISEEKRVGGLSGSRVLYCGMPNEKTFSITPAFNPNVNIYYPSDSKEIYFYGKKYEVVSVKPETLVLRFIPEQKP